MTERINLDPEASLTPFRGTLYKGKLLRIPPPTDGNDSQPKLLEFQYNPETITRSRTGKWEPRQSRQRNQRAPSPQDVRGRSGQGPASLMAESETISLKVVFDATEAIMARDTVATAEGVRPLLAALEIITMGKEVRARNGQRDAARSVRPDELLLILGDERMYPVVLTSLSITEQKFRARDLVPIRAEADLKFNVLEPTEQAYSQLTTNAFNELKAKREASAGKSYSSDASANAIAGALRGNPPE